MFAHNRIPAEHRNHAQCRPKQNRSGFQRGLSVTSGAGGYSQAFVRELKIFQVELRDFFNATGAVA